jgi:hypothetical protein
VPGIDKFIYVPLGPVLILAPFTPPLNPIPLLEKLSLNPPPRFTLFLKYKPIKNSLYIQEKYEYSSYENRVAVHKTINEKIRHNNAWIVYDKEYLNVEVVDLVANDVKNLEKNLIKEASRRPTHARYLVGYYVISSNSFRWFVSPSIRYLKRLLEEINLIGSNVIGDYAVWGIFDVHKIPIYTNISGLYVSSKNEESDTLANWIQRGFKDE